MVVHNEYRSAFPSGENRIVEDEIEGLRRAGVEVQPYLRSSDELESMSVRDRMGAALAPLTGGSSRHAFRDAARSFRPDVVHLHNPYPLISPRLITWCRRMGIPVVATIHNFRLRCMNGQLYRDGAVCTLCESSATTLPGVTRGCYRESLPESALMGTALMVHRGAWSHVTRFIAVSDFVAERLESWGIDPQRIVVKVNPVDDPGPPGPPGVGSSSPVGCRRRRAFHCSWMRGSGPVSPIESVSCSPVSVHSRSSSELGRSMDQESSSSVASLPTRLHRSGSRLHAGCSVRDGSRLILP